MLFPNYELVSGEMGELGSTVLGGEYLEWPSLSRALLDLEKRGWAVDLATGVITSSDGGKHRLLDGSAQSIGLAKNIRQYTNTTDGGTKYQDWICDKENARYYPLRADADGITRPGEMYD